MASETYPCYVKVGIETKEFVELPTEKNGTMLLSTVASQFPGALGLRFKSESGSWRGVRLSDDNILDAPLEGWGENTFHVVMLKRAVKRQAADLDDSRAEKSSRMTTTTSTENKVVLPDLVVLRLPFAATEADMTEHFEQYGEVDMCDIKYHKSNNKSKGFGFVRLKTIEAMRSVLDTTHILLGQEVEVAFPKDKATDDQILIGAKLFIGRLPKGITLEEFREHFEQFGEIKDAYIPTPFKGFGFVIYKKQITARFALVSTHILKGQEVNVSHPSPKSHGLPEREDYSWYPGFRNQGYGNQGPLGIPPIRSGRYGFQGNMNYGSSW